MTICCSRHGAEAEGRLGLVGVGLRLLVWDAPHLPDALLREAILWSLWIHRPHARDGHIDRARCNSNRAAQPTGTCVAFVRVPLVLADLEPLLVLPSDGGTLDSAAVWQGGCRCGRVRNLSSAGLDRVRSRPLEEELVAPDPFRDCPGMDRVRERVLDRRNGGRRLALRFSSGLRGRSPS